MRTWATRKWIVHRRKSYVGKVEFQCAFTGRILSAEVTNLQLTDGDVEEGGGEEKLI